MKFSLSIYLAKQALKYKKTDKSEQGGRYFQGEEMMCKFIWLQKTWHTQRIERIQYY
jgi:hypothetical protein